MTEYIGFVHEKRAIEVKLDINGELRPHEIAGSGLIMNKEYVIFLEYADQLPSQAGKKLLITYPI